jgi:hypothetical protein
MVMPYRSLISGPRDNTVAGDVQGFVGVMLLVLKPTSGPKVKAGIISSGVTCSHSTGAIESLRGNA